MYNYKCKICGNTQSSDFPPSMIHICDFCGHVDIPLWAINLYKCNDIPYIIRVLKAEQQRRAEKDPVGVIYYWETIDNNVMRIDTMSDSHLENTIKMLERKIKREENGIKESLEGVWG